MSKAEDIQVVIDRYKIVLEELRAIQRFYRNLRHSIDPEKMTPEQELQLFRTKKKVSDISRKFYYARAAYQTDMSRILADGAANMANEYVNPEVLSDNAIKDSLLNMKKDKLYREGFGKGTDLRNGAKSVLQMLREKGKLNPEQLAKLCVCGHTYAEHIKIEGCTKCSVEDCEAMCNEFELSI